MSKKSYKGLAAAAIGVIGLIASSIAAGKLLDPDRLEDKKEKKEEEKK